MNKFIKEFSTSLLVPSEFVACAGRFNQILSNVQNDAFVTSQSGKMMDSASRVEEAIQAKKVRLFTDDLAAKEEARNEAFLDLYNYLEGTSQIGARPENKADADFLLTIIKKAGNRLDKLASTKKTGSITTLLDNFKEPTALETIGRLGIADLVDALTKAQTEFEGIYRTKIKAEAKIVQTNDAHAECKEVGYHICSLLQYVDAQSQIDPSFNGVISELNEVISDVMSKAHSRKTRSKDNGETSSVESVKPSEKNA